MSERKIFISYRRDDAAGYARAVFDQLVARFTKQRVFMDVEAIDPGLPFDRVIDEAVGSCQVVLVMIGPRWEGPQADQAARIHDPDDFVHLEIAAALSRDVRVIPVLLDGASMPAREQLPESLQALARRNAIRVSNERFGADIDRLVDAIAKALGEATPAKPRSGSRRPLLYVGALAGFAVAVPGMWWMSRRAAPDDDGPDRVQAGWRFCRKCQSLFFDGYARKGVCAAGGEHVAEGYRFFLRHDTVGAGQRDWRFCEKCMAMFFDGEAAKGVCPAGGSHSAQGFNFLLAHDVAGGGQPDWRYCRKCRLMFFDGYPGKGVCAASGGHDAQGFNFVLPFR